MSKHNHGTYNIIQFSDKPDTTEFVNVALFIRSKLLQLYYDPKFPRLKQASPMLEYYLKLYANKLPDISKTAKFRIDNDHELIVPPSKDLIEILKSKHLSAINK